MSSVNVLGTVSDGGRIDLYPNCYMVSRAGIDFDPNKVRGHGDEDEKVNLAELSGMTPVADAEQPTCNDCGGLGLIFPPATARGGNGVPCGKCDTGRFMARQEAKRSEPLATIAEPEAESVADRLTRIQRDLARITGELRDLRRDGVAGENGINFAQLSLRKASDWVAYVADKNS